MVHFIIVLGTAHKGVAQPKERTHPAAARVLHLVGEAARHRLLEDV